jgi:hypothetical protein
MNDSLTCRAASKADLPDVLRLYAQPDLDDDVLSVAKAERIFDRMMRYPDYQVYVAVAGVPSHDLLSFHGFLKADKLGGKIVIEDQLDSPPRQTLHLFGEGLFDAVGPRFQTLGGSVAASGSV